ncbi:MAG: VCBS repeat-containing protein [Cyclobacterium sp.]|uniref:FG-GAP repeat domain-containing protein n=1 Tax=unclassified Cyclobacterium TaxID=2615055 RepID=UPI0013D411FE|nr:VCBS repeat-containing protein [Cyclobacterium sp. SYSU L10401]
MNNCIKLLILLLMPLISHGQREKSNSGTTPWKMHRIDNTSLGADGSKMSDVNGDGKLDVVVGWEEGGVGRLYFQPENAKAAWPFVEVKAPDVEDAFAIDLDGDGRQDLITLSEGNHQRVTVHWGPKEESDIINSQAWKSADFPETVGRSKWMFGRAMDIDGKNGLDLIVGSKNPSGTIGWLASPEDPRNMEAWEYHEISEAGWIMSIELIDMNHNGRKDLLITDRKGDLRGLRWLENPGPGTADQPWKNHFIGLQEGEPMFMGLYADENSHLPNIIVPDLVNGWIHFIREKGEWQQEVIPYPEGSGYRGKSVRVADIDQDGTKDLLASFEGALGKSGVIALLDFQRASPEVLDISGLDGVKYDFITLIDMDGDGDLDVLTSEETAEDGSKSGLGVIWYENPLK